MGMLRQRLAIGNSAPDESGEASRQDIPIGCDRHDARETQRSKHRRYSPGGRYVHQKQKRNEQDSTDADGADTPSGEYREEEVQRKGVRWR